jgi:nucleoside-diphosphate-sugar epimerase
VITVIGGSGFIGTRLCQRLHHNGQTFGIVDKNPSARFSGQVRRADVRSIDELRAAIGPSRAIINLAAEHRDDVRPVSLYEAVNRDGARHVCQVAEERDIRTIVFTSSVAVYGFAPPDTDETGTINHFNEYGRTKYLAEEVYREWQRRDPKRRSLVIVRPTVVFGEQNRGNVYNLLRQIASGRFVMVGSGRNRKSMAYVENVAAFLEHSLAFGPGEHLHNYIDKPDFDMNTLVAQVRQELGRPQSAGIRLPYPVGLGIGYAFDLAARLSGRRFAASSIRVRKFCATTQFASSAGRTGFIAPVSLQNGLRNTVRHEFLENHQGETVYFSE